MGATACIRKEWLRKCYLMGRWLHVENDLRMKNGMARVKVKVRNEREERCKSKISLENMRLKSKGGINGAHGGEESASVIKVRKIKEEEQQERSAGTDH